MKLFVFYTCLYILLQESKAACTNFGCCYCQKNGEIISNGRYAPSCVPGYECACFLLGNRNFEGYCAENGVIRIYNKLPKDGISGYVTFKSTHLCGTRQPEVYIVPAGNFTDVLYKGVCYVLTITGKEFEEDFPCAPYTDGPEYKEEFKIVPNSNPVCKIIPM